MRRCVGRRRFLRHSGGLGARAARALLRTFRPRLSRLLMKFSLKQLTQQGSSEGLCVVAVMAATFTRTSFGDHVEVGLHAIAVDEHRRPFVPTFWTISRGQKPKGHVEQT
jgi:hypothetical protein